MTKTVTLLFILFLAIPVYSQKATKPKELSNAEQFSEKAGILVEKEFIDIGSVRDAKIEVMLLKDLINSIKLSAVRFEYEQVDGDFRETKTAILDADEVEGLIKSIKILQSRILPTTKKNYTEVTFQSRGGFEAGCYWSDDEWKTYLKLDKSDRDSYIFLNAEDFGTLLKLLEQAKVKL